MLGKDGGRLSFELLGVEDFDDITTEHQMRLCFFVNGENGLLQLL